MVFLKDASSLAVDLSLASVRPTRIISATPASAKDLAMAEPIP